MLFESDSVTKVQNKFSTKLALWLLEKEIAKRADSIVKKQAEKVASMEIDYELSSGPQFKKCLFPLSPTLTFRVG